MVLESYTYGHNIECIYSIIQVMMFKNLKYIGIIYVISSIEYHMNLDEYDTTYNFVQNVIQ